MKFFCLTSLTTDSDHELGKTYPGRDWVFSEIQIGKQLTDKEDNFYFLLFRNGMLVFQTNLAKISMEVVSLEATLGPHLTDIMLYDGGLLINPFELGDVMDLEIYLVYISIRCIKIPSTTEPKLDESTIKEELILYAEKIQAKKRDLIEEFGYSYEEAYEKAFDVIDPLIIPGDAPGHSITNIKNELKNALKDLCPSNKPRKINLSAKYNNNIDVTLLKVTPDNYDRRWDKQRKSNIYEKCQVLAFYDVILPAISPRWFKSENLYALQFHNIKYGFAKKEALEAFQVHIGSVPNLNTLMFNNCEVSEIKASFYSSLPKTLKHLILKNINLIRITKEIATLSKLKTLMVDGNLRLEGSNIAWEDLPETLEILSLKNTAVKSLPHSDRLKKIKSLSIDNLESVNISKLASSLTNIHIKGCPISNFPENCDFIDLRSSKIEEFNEAIFPDILKHLNLHDNLLTSCEFTRDFEFLTSLTLSKNKKLKISWGSLPVNLTMIDVSYNELKAIGPLSHLVRLERLNLSHNNLTVIPEEIGGLSNMIEINLSYNQLKELPRNFECPHYRHPLVLNLKSNHFTYDKDPKSQNDNAPNLKERLWDRLPPTSHLILSLNTLKSLPCELKGKCQSIIAVDCHLEHICPHLSYCLTYLNIYKNPKLDHLPFIPEIIYHMPLETKLKASTQNVTGKILIAKPSLVKPPSKFPMWVDKFVYSFETSSTKCITCKCCACCPSKDTKFIKQKMVMDFTLLNVNDTIIADNFLNNDDLYYDLTIDIKKRRKYPAWLPGQWVTSVRTNLCSGCIKFLKAKTSAVYELHELLKISESSDIPTKKSRSKATTNTIASKNVNIKKLTRLVLNNAKPFISIAYEYHQNQLSSVCENLDLSENGIMKRVMVTLSVLSWTLTNTNSITKNLLGDERLRPLKSILHSEDKFYIGEFLTFVKEVWSNINLSSHHLEKPLFCGNTSEPIRNQFNALLPPQNVSNYQSEQSGFQEQGFIYQYSNYQNLSILDQPVMTQNNQLEAFYPTTANVLPQNLRQNNQALQWKTYDLVDNCPSFDWLYYYPEKVFLRGLCDSIGVEFKSYSFENRNNGYGFFNSPQMLTKSIQGDGHCGFRALSFLITGTEDYHGKFRQKIRSYILEQRLPVVFYERFREALNECQTNFNSWMKEFDLVVAAFLFRLNIFVFTNRNGIRWSLYNYSLLNPDFNGVLFDENLFSILLSNTNNLHYDAILDVAV